MTKLIALYITAISLFIMAITNIMMYNVEKDYLTEPISTPGECSSKKENWRSA